MTDVPSPTSPAPLAPQQANSPRTVIAHPCASPTLTVLVPNDSAGTPTGTAELAVVRSPNWAKELSPQHTTGPAVVTAHADWLPATTVVTPDVSPVTLTGTFESVGWLPFPS